MHYLSITLTATAACLANASALPPVDDGLSTITPDLAPRRFDPLSLAWIPDLAENGMFCHTSGDCKSNFCEDNRCTVSSCKTDQDCSGRICSRKNKCIATQLYDNSGCEQDNQCRSGKCGNGKCTPGKGYYSAACSSNQECNRGLFCRKADYLGRNACLDPKIYAGGHDKGGEDEGAPCGRPEDCKEGLECRDQSSGVQKFTGIFSGQPPKYQCVAPVKEQCTGLKAACWSDSDCCSKNCKTTEILFVRQCEK
ncbi:hypothetical protein N7492_004102 [Penicillium capsulatum]|uniref:Dickkopf N-terminal cysteine-rich domain-containing protein n=1 Tax=Penicillium capsulatum TaxID=69766 RepID=A0A9W9LY25_9EURO|nr:hypothetical protein N7492_004102 [Penicillium capsulatum]KAJ6121325.1 hypothetical protein N7512_003790 [Penicillium capsulatum]